LYDNNWRLQVATNLEHTMDQGHRNAQKHPARAQNSSAALQIADEIKQLILTRDLPLGASVKEKWVTQHFMTSRSTARETIGLLVSQRFLTQSHHKSAHVRPYSPKELRDILDARSLLEGYAAKTCSEASSQAKTRLQSAFADYASTITSDALDDAAFAHLDLHVAVVGLTDNEELILAEHRLMAGSLLFIEIINQDRQDTQKMYNEHLQIVNALLEPNPPLAQKLIEDHLSMLEIAAHTSLYETIG
jgi:DNA-binding GntR family transcriptional regulator